MFGYFKLTQLRLVCFYIFCIIYHSIISCQKLVEYTSRLCTICKYSSNAYLSDLYLGMLFHNLCNILCTFCRQSMFSILDRPLNGLSSALIQFIRHRLYDFLIDICSSHNIKRRLNKQMTTKRLYHYFFMWTTENIVNSVIRPHV